MKKSLLEMDSVLIELEVANEKAKTILNDLNNIYFSDVYPKEWLLKYYYDLARVKVAIVYDYDAGVKT